MLGESDNCLESQPEQDAGDGLPLPAVRERSNADARPSTRNSGDPDRPDPIHFLLLKPDFGGWQSNALGLALAGASACFWASYILCIRRLGSVFKGNEGLAVALTVAAILILPLALLYPPPTPNAGSIGLAMMIALLAPILPCILEMQALRMMSTRSFSILMSFEPGVGAIAGFAFLAQSPSVPQAVGLALVVFASMGSVLTSQ